MPEEYKDLNCREVGQGLSEALRQHLAQVMMQQDARFSGECDFVARGATVEEVMQQLAAHASQKHGIMGWPPEMWGHIMRGVRTVRTV